MRERIYYDEKEQRVIVTARALASFAANGRGIPFENTDTSGCITDSGVCVAADLDRTLDGLRVCGTVEYVTESPLGFAVVKTVRGSRAGSTPDNHMTDAAELAALGLLFCREHDLDRVILRLVFEHGDGDDIYEYSAGAEYLATACAALIDRALPFAELVRDRGRIGMPAMRALPFPYPEIRESQHTFINEAFRAIKKGRRLLVSAPTGTGKTISALYPAVRAIGEGACDKIFCLCAKATVGRVFVDAAELLSHHVPTLKCVVISSKERCCPVYHGGTRRPKRCAVMCPLMGADQNRRLAAAAVDCLKHSVIDAKVISDAADAHKICPHELSLLVSEYADIVVCDYNYVFDFRIRLKRYFENSDEPDPTSAPPEKYVLLADEVHNLPKRAADTYSAELALSSLDELAAAASKLDGAAVICDAVRALSEEMRRIMDGALRDGETNEVGGAVVKSGFICSKELPQGLCEAAGVLRRTLGTYIFRHGAAAPPIFTDVGEIVGKFCHVASLFGDNYTFFASAIGDDFYVRLLCLDPSPLLDSALSVATSVIFFSATLSPISYYADILGCGEGAVLELESPFPPENLCPVAVDSVSMKLSERAAAAPDVAEMIASAVEGRCGNYLAFFPSFDSMESVLKIFREIAPDVNVAVQSRKMGQDARRKFLSEFTRERDEWDTLVGFAVLGGIFSEGIDLPGSSLIGVIIAGTGMPAITSERNIMKEYFDRTRESGMEYAYIYPGMNSVLQAAGRVIRTENDRGVLVLIDSRYAEPTYYKLFPKSYRHIKYTGDSFSLGEILRRFWEKGGDAPNMH